MLRDSQSWLFSAFEHR